MPTTDYTVLHAPFFEALSKVSEVSSQDWRRLSAGLVCLRLVDRVSMNGGASTDACALQLQATWEKVEALDTSDAVRRVLASLLQSLEADGSRYFVTARPRLMAYGRVLELESRWALAADVYETVTRLCRAHRDIGDANDAAAACIRLGECWRHEAKWDDAQRAFRDAAAHAAFANDLPTALRARCLDASVTSERGNLPRANAQLRRVASEARAAGLKDALALAFHGRAHVAFQRGRFETAVRFAFRAVRGLRDPLARDRALGDVAAAFAELGVRQSARDAHLILAATTQEPFVRGAAWINLMELAALDRMEPLFEQYRRQLATEKLPPRLAGYYHFYAGRAAWQFGRVETARSEYERAVELAEKNGLAQLSLDIDRAVPILNSAPSSPPPACAPPSRTAPVARALVRMREEVCAAAS